MPFDGGFTHKVVQELSEAVDCHIDKIYQTSKDELVFLLRKKGYAKRLLISAKPGAARLHFTEQKYENPTVPPMFCMLARKHFSSARFMEARQNGLERVIELCFETTNEMGDRIHPRVICELIGNQTNIVLVGEEDRIIDAVRRSDIEENARLVQPGAKYEYPPTQGKIDLLCSNIDVLVEHIYNEKELPLSKALLKVLDGFSPLLCREIAFRACGGDDITAEVAETRLRAALTGIIADLTSNQKPLLLCKPDNTPADFSYTELTQYPNTYHTALYESFSQLLDAFYAKRENLARIHHAAADILRLVGNLHTRAIKRLAARKQELKQCENREQFRIYGELLKANLHSLSLGKSYAEVQNYYDENLGLVRIPLNPALSPSANAARYFKDYKKTYTAQQTLTELTRKDEQEILYLESVLDSITRCETLSDLNEIREELTDAGYLRSRQNTKAKRKTVVSGFKEYVSAEGFRILVGRNNRQNDHITTHLAGKNDLWFHTKNIPGSHVVVFSGGEEVSDQTILFAAGLAAFNSKAGASDNVPVDYTPIRYVKKPNGAKLGMVIYTTNKTIYVTPKETLE